MGPDPSPPPAADVAAEQFYSGAIRRILRILAVLAIAVAVPIWLAFGLATMLGFSAGAAASWLNFQSLARGVEGLADRIVNAHSQERGSMVVARFLLRYLLVGIVAYAIFKGSFYAFRGFLAGLCLPVAAVLSEAVYEAYAAFRRGY
ncbi:MAG TPA: ATP synthase subunit I [Terriglobales bacterium]|nr:ATP synthase subunit I [Terriglobales bacterium]